MYINFCIKVCYYVCYLLLVAFLSLVSKSLESDKKMELPVDTNAAVNITYTS